MIVLGYIYIIYIIVRYFFGIVKYKRVTLPSIDLFKVNLKSRSAQLFLLFFVAANFSMYTAIRSQWINKDSLHHNAKEFFVVGLNAVFYKKVLDLLFKPDATIMMPLDRLMKRAYQEGVRLLPANDGERFYWRYRLFNYWFIRGAGYMPGYNPRAPKPVTPYQQKILNEMWEVLEGLATSKIADPLVDAERYKAFAAVGKYYLYKRFVPYNKYVVKRLWDRDKVALKDKGFIEKEKIFLKWTSKLKEKYKQNKRLKRQIEQEIPVLGVSYLLIIHDLSEEMVFKSIIEKNLHCDDKYVDFYISASKELVSKGSPLYRMSGPQQKLIYEITFDNQISYFVIYTLDKECGKKLTVGYPSQEWIAKGLPFMRKVWLDTDEVEDKSSDIDLNAIKNKFNKGGE
jgi:hypothetical protein